MRRKAISGKAVYRSRCRSWGRWFHRINSDQVSKSNSRSSGHHYVSF